MSKYTYECPKCHKSFTSEERLAPTMCPECPKGGLVGVLQFVEGSTVSDALSIVDLNSIANRVLSYADERAALLKEIDALKKDYWRLNEDFCKLKDAYRDISNQAAEAKEKAKQGSFWPSEFNTFEQVKIGITLADALKRTTTVLVISEETKNALMVEVNRIHEAIGSEKLERAKYLIGMLAYVPNPNDELKTIMQQHVEKLIKQFDEKYRPRTIADGSITWDKLNVEVATANGDSK